MTWPGVQKPHCEPLHAAMRSCTGWKPASREPMPSAVVTAMPSQLSTGRRQPFTARWSHLPAAASQEVSVTVQAPHPPWLHESLAPVRPRFSRRNSSRVMRGWISCGSAVTCTPFTKSTSEPLSVGSADACGLAPPSPHTYAAAAAESAPAAIILGSMAMFLRGSRSYGSTAAAVRFAPCCAHSMRIVDLAVGNRNSQGEKSPLGS